MKLPWYVKIEGQKVNNTFKLYFKFNKFWILCQMIKVCLQYLGGKNAIQENK